jgi:hypothetical protein
MKYWIKERHNPQFPRPYYVPCGRITNKEASRKGAAVYGYNRMLEFATEEEYKAKLNELIDAGEEVRP